MMQKGRGLRESIWTKDREVANTSVELEPASGRFTYGRGRCARSCALRNPLRKTAKSRGNLDTASGLSIAIHDPEAARTST